MSEILDFAEFNNDDAEPERSNEPEKKREPRQPKQPSMDEGKVKAIVEEMLKGYKGELRDELHSMIGDFKSTAAELWKDVYGVLVKMFRSGDFRKKVEKLNALLEGPGKV